MRELEGPQAFCVPTASAMVHRQEQTQGVLLSTGLIDGLNFQEDLKPTSALMTFELSCGSQQKTAPKGEAAWPALGGGPLTQVPRPGRVQDLQFRA